MSRHAMTSLQHQFNSVPEALDELSRLHDERKRAAGELERIDVAIVATCASVARLGASAAELRDVRTTPAPPRSQTLVATAEAEQALVEDDECEEAEDGDEPDGLVPRPGRHVPPASPPTAPEPPRGNRPTGRGLRARIVEALERRAMTANELADALGGELGTVQTTLSQLKNDGKVYKGSGHPAKWHAAKGGAA